MTTIWDKLAEAVQHLDEPFHRSEIVGWFRRRHPEVNEASLGAHIQSAVAGVNRGQFASRAPLLERVGHGLYQRSRDQASTRTGRAAPARSPGEAPPARALGAADLVLVSCTSRKQAQAAPAAELYLGTGFVKATEHADRIGAPWFVLSARYGLLSPSDVIGPYDVQLSKCSASYRRTWGEWVASQLVEALASVDSLTIEVHAGEAYVGSLREPLNRLGAIVSEPLAGLRQGQRLAWYGAPTVDEPVDWSFERLVEMLRSAHLAVAVDELSDRTDLRNPGLYTWWIDEAGAADLSAGLGHPVAPGMIYAGLAGATRWPSGKRSTNTLHGRLIGMHLGKRVDLSTFRLSLAAALVPAMDWDGLDEPALTRWMRAHLRVVAVPYADADGLGKVESRLLAALDPPLNLSNVASTPLRQRLSALRRRMGER